MIGKDSLIGFHGFLGTPQDFDALIIPHLHGWDIFKEPILPLKQWAKTFNQKLPSPVGLLGYSLGGRLALHCLCDDEKKYSFAIILAANPGLKSPEERALRLLNDKKWAKKFLDDPWVPLLAEWNGQPVLKNAQAPMRNEQDFSREQLSRALTYFSVGHQGDLREKISALSIPILWVCPSVEQGNIEGISFKNQRSRMVIVDGSHRFFMEKPTAIRELIVDFMSRLGAPPFAFMDKYPFKGSGHNLCA